MGIRCRTLLVVVVVASCTPPGAPADELVPLHELIDRHIEHRLMQQEVTAAGPATDAEFLRRVHLDLTGSIPDAAAASAYLEDPDPQKRRRLIDRLLESDAYARRMAVVFDVMLMERRPDDHVTTAEWRDYLTRAFAENRPLNVLVAEILGADGVEETLRPAAKFYLDRDVEKDALVQDIGRLLLGVDLTCAQCHDHPDILDYLHRDYYGLSVFVAGTKTFRQPDGKVVLEEVALREVEYASVFDPDTSRKTGPRILERPVEVPQLGDEPYVEPPSKKVRSVPKISLRKLLAERLPSDETPQFARNMANRLWAMMFGRGLVHPLHMHHSANPPSHPELLSLLAERLRTSGYDVKAFLRELALSAAYGRSGVAPEGVDPDGIPPESFAVANMKGLSPEQLFESILVATGSEAILEQQIDQAMLEQSGDGEPDQEPDGDADGQKDTAARRRLRAERVAEFVDVFGGAPGQPEDPSSASLPQALFLANGETISAWIPPRSGNLADRLMALPDANAVADELFLSVLSRYPLEAERQLVADHWDATEAERRKSLSLLIWSLLASAEFRLNH